MKNQFEIIDKSFQKLTDNSALSTLATGFTFTEGPIWHKNSLLFSDIPNSRIIKYELRKEGPSVNTFRHPSGNSNGMTLDLNDNLIVCEHSNRRVTSTNSEGLITEIASEYNGMKLNSPNDVVVKSDGWIYFTDPPYGLPERFESMEKRKDGKELDFNGVYKVRPDGSDLSLIISNMTAPNGLAFSPDESVLYVADSFELIIKKYNVNQDGTVDSGINFADLNTGEEGAPDGMKVDRDGRLFSTGPNGIWIFEPNGALLGKIFTPEIPANCGWGLDGNTLFITARKSLYSITLDTYGIPTGSQSI